MLTLFLISLSHLQLRAPRSRYEFKRSRTLLKVKTFFDEEAIVVGIVKGSGKNSHRMGHLEVKTPDGRLFSVGSGFTDAQRDKPPKVGTVITYKFQELSNKLNPRFPTFIGERIDVKWTDYCKTYTPPTLKAATPAKVVSLLKQKSLIFQGGDSDDSDKDKTNGNGNVNGDIDTDEDDPADPRSSSPSSKSPSSSSSSSTPSVATTTSSLNRKRALQQQTDKSDDSDDDTKTTSKQQPCKYGAACYRRNPDHLKQYSHPNKRAKI